ncbi:tail fiber domain-containing protein [Portibacter marinus]|uniref:tail fiber domain-containing protein n=1 Tax=Portibacter marinus TaxID=2898660 RepID=UPI001F402071|nr:tail fiber domain-containing protein [Portibacter marinus]
MKVFTITFTLLLFTIFSHAQMIVDDGGDVGIGGSYGSTKFTVPLGLALEVSGEVYMNGGVGKGVYIQDYIGDVIFTGGFNNEGFLGKYNERWGDIYGESIHYDNLYQGSDISIKENIVPLESALVKILAINAVKYDLKASYYENSDPELIDELISSGKNKVGVIAQELDDILPNLVKFNEEAGIHMVNYVDMIPYLIKAIQEQQVVIDELKSKVNLLEIGK